MKNLLVFLKDTSTKQISVIYRLQYEKTEYDDEYIGESSRAFGERYIDHLKAHSPIFEHQNTTGYITVVDNFQIIGRERCNMARAIKEAI